LKFNFDDVISVCVQGNQLPEKPLSTITPPARLNLNSGNFTESFSTIFLAEKLPP